MISKDQEKDFYSTLGNPQANNILKSYSNVPTLSGEDKDADLLIKSGAGLTARKVLVKKKDGSTYYATRFVSNDGGKATMIQHPKYEHEDSLPGSTEEEKIANIVDNDSLKPLDKVRKLAALGIYDKTELASMSQHKYPADIPTLLKKEAGIDPNNLTNPNATLPTTTVSPAPLSSPTVQRMAIADIEANMGKKEAFKAQSKLREELMEKYNVTVGDKWNSYESRLNRLIVDGNPKSVMAYGTGGVGKTYTFDKLAEHNKLVEYDAELDMDKNSEEYDYIRFSGKIGSREMQRAMFEHSNKLLVFDDCDSMWGDDGLINVLKASLDSSGNGTCQWAAAQDKGKETEVPARFRFEGRMVFITNLTKQELVEAGAGPVVDSRASSIDLTMNMEQTIERLNDILPYVRIKDYKGITIPTTEEDKKAALGALSAVMSFARTEQLNTRVLGHVLAEARSQRINNDGVYNEQKLQVFLLQQLGVL